MYPENLKYSKEHLWVLIEGDMAKAGITDYAQKQLGNIVLLELPESGAKAVKGKSFGVVESVKSVSDLFAPVSGEVTGVNTAATENPETVNKDPYGKGWMIEIKLADQNELGLLLSASYYEKLITTR